MIFKNMLILMTLVIMQLHCLTSLFMHKSSLLSNRFTCNRDFSLGITSINEFSLESYSKTNFIRPYQSVKINFILKSNTSTKTNDDDDHDYIGTQQSSTVILTSLGIRQLDDIVTANPRIPDFNKLALKLKQSQQDISSDKFLYSHDVGDNSIKKVSVCKHHVFQVLTISIMA